MAGVRVRLTFRDDLIKEPLVGRMMRQYDVLPNIRRADIDDTLGWMICEITGERAVVEEALNWIAREGVQVDRLGDRLSLLSSTSRTVPEIALAPVPVATFSRRVAPAPLTAKALPPLLTAPTRLSGAVVGLSVAAATEMRAAVPNAAAHAAGTRSSRRIPTERLVEPERLIAIAKRLAARGQTFRL